MFKIQVNQPSRLIIKPTGSSSQSTNGNNYSTGNRVLILKKGSIIMLEPIEKNNNKWFTTNCYHNDLDFPITKKRLFGSFSEISFDMFNFSFLNSCDNQNSVESVNDNLKREGSNLCNQQSSTNNKLAEDDLNHGSDDGTTDEESFSKMRTIIVPKKSKHTKMKYKSVGSSQFIFSLDKPRLILDYMNEKKNKKILVEVNSILVKKLKSHQIDGINFMYNRTIRSVDKLPTGGSGCILAHCIGSGKTFQVVTLVQTLLSNKHFKDHIKTILISVPANKFQNWIDEFDKWITKNGLKTFEIHEMINETEIENQVECLNRWKIKGGILLIGHDDLLNLFKLLSSNETFLVATINEHLVNPGPDLLILDEGFLILNKPSYCEVFSNIQTTRKIILAGYPLRNNSNAYHSMVTVIKPHLLQSQDEFDSSSNNLVANVQETDTNRHDVKLMVQSSTSSHQPISDCIQTFGFEILEPYLKPKFEYTLFIRPTKLIAQMYNFYLDHKIKKAGHIWMARGLDLCVNHPVLYHVQKEREKAKKKRSMENQVPQENITEKESHDNDFSDHDVEDASSSEDWYSKFVSSDDWENIELSGKFILLFKILKVCISLGDKLVVVSHSVETLDLIEKSLELFKRIQHGDREEKIEWKLDKNYFRFTSENDDFKKRQIQLNKFNDPQNVDARLFLLTSSSSPIPLTGANRCIIFDVSWNPLDDVQAISRIYRLGQTKLVYVYRFVAKDSMEELIFRKLFLKSRSIPILSLNQAKRFFKPHEQSAFFYTRPKETYSVTLSHVPEDRLLANVLQDGSDEVLECINFDILSSIKPQKKSPDKRLRQKVFERQKVQNSLPNEQSERFIEPKDVADNEQDGTNLILGIETKPKEIIVKVNSVLGKELKPYQLEGIKFMYNSTIGNVDKLTKKGSGCILAHCMGSGKKLQVITLAQTLLSNEHLKDHIKTILIAVGSNKMMDWIDEFDKWITNNRLKTFEVHEMVDETDLENQVELLNRWKSRGGILIMSHSVLTDLLHLQNSDTSVICRSKITLINKHLTEPGPDILIIDENKGSEWNYICEALKKVKTKRKIILTGTALMNDFNQCRVMVSIVKHKISKFQRNFFKKLCRPKEKVKSGSSELHVKLVRQKWPDLCQTLSDCIQMFGFEVLQPYLPPKYEFTLFVRPTELIARMYNFYLAHVGDKTEVFSDAKYLRLCVNHPVLYEFQREAEKAKFGNVLLPKNWYRQFIHFNEWKNIGLSCKFVLLFKILNACVSVGDKLVVFSQSSETLDLIEKCLQLFKRIQFDDHDEKIEWKKKENYFRFYSSDDPKETHDKLVKFNDPENKAARLFLLYTRVGGISLTGADRVVIFDVSWSPSDDVQTISRVYRLGQTKPVYVYRFVAKDSMEEFIFRERFLNAELVAPIYDSRRVEKAMKPYKQKELYKMFPKETYSVEQLQVYKDDLLADILSDGNKEVLEYIEFDVLHKYKLEEHLIDDQHREEENENQESQLEIDPREKFKEDTNENSKIDLDETSFS